MTDIDKVLKFWFQDYDLSSVSQYLSRWFIHGEKLDSIIKEEFKDIHDSLSYGHLTHWLDSAKGFIAFIIVGDQFSRHIYRDTSKAYAFDDLVSSVVRQHFHKYFFQLHDYEKLFGFIVFQHSENLRFHIHGLEILRMYMHFSCVNKALFENVLFHAERHAAVIRRYKRFPKRNLALGRESTEDEKLYISKNTKYLY